jgi:hypothetical protein
MQPCLFTEIVLPVAMKERVLGILMRLGLKGLLLASNEKIAH